MSRNYIIATWVASIFLVICMIYAVVSRQEQHEEDIKADFDNIETLYKADKHGFCYAYHFSHGILQAVNEVSCEQIENEKLSKESSFEKYLETHNKK